MERVIRAVSLIAFAAWMTGCASMHQGNDQAMIAGAKGVDQRFMQAFNAGSVDGVMECYWKSEQVLLFPPDAMMVRGWDQIKAGYSAMMAQMHGARMELLESHYRPAGDEVTAWGLWRITLTSGGPVMNGRFTEVIGRREGRWVYLIDHPSVPVPPPDATKK